MKIKTVISLLTLLILLSTATFVGMHLKTKPLITLASVTLLAILFLFYQKEKAATFLLFLIIGLSAFLFWFMSCSIIKNAVSTQAPINGHFVMDMGWIFYIPIAIVLAGCTIFLYFKKMDRNKYIELSSLIVYLLATIIELFK